jgi:hypothetical protein
MKRELLKKLINQLYFEKTLCIKLLDYMSF